jgi:uncharacterized membrane protein YhaH (DUF805 family)
VANLKFSSTFRDALIISFVGRINRTAYWIGAIIWTAIFLGSLFAISRSFDQESQFQLKIAGALAVILLGFFQLASLSLAVRRWHDRNKPGWMQLVVLIPVLGPFWVLAECGLRAGTTGPNDFGIPRDWANPGFSTPMILHRSAKIDAKINIQIKKV